MTEREDVYITTTETLYPGDTRYDEVVVRLYGRTRDHETRTITVRNFPPYFLARAEEREKVRPADYEELIEYQEVETDPLSERFDDSPEDLVKVIAKYPHSVRNLRQEFDRTWGADAIFTEQFRVDSGVKTGVRVPKPERDGHVVVEKEEIEPVEVKDVTPRVLTLDIETDDRDAGFPDPGEARILSIAAYDSYEQEQIVFLDLDGESIPDFFDLPEIARSAWEDGKLGLSDLGLDEPDKLVTKQSEEAMLRTFSAWVRESNPDIISGWNSGDEANDGFDIPHIIQRMKNLSCSPERLSRESEVEIDRRGDDFLPSIKGRALYDLMNGWGDTKFTEPRSFKLDDVAEEKLDDTKIEHPDMGYFEMYRDDPVRFVNYNVKDTRLTVEINEEENVLGFKKRLKDMVGVDWRRTHQNNEYIEMSVRRKCREHDIAMITAYDNPHVIEAMESGGDDVNYEGAHVESAFSGVKRNVCGVDLASLYPMTQWMLNASPDTRIEAEKGSEEWWAMMEEVGKREDGSWDYVEAANGQCFRTDVDGIIRELVDEYHEVKAEFKAERNAATYGTSEWAEAAEAYNVTKTIYNSFYGYSGWARSPLYNPDDAAAITLTGQDVIKATAEYFRNQAADGVKVVYGDTDSNYVQFPDDWSQEETLDYAKDSCDDLTNEVYPPLCDDYNIPRSDNRWEIEVEMRAKRFFMSGSKKNYAYLKMWDEGDDHDQKVADGKGKFDVTGYQCVKSNFSMLTKETQEQALEQIVRGASKEDVVETVHNAACSIDAADPDWDYIGIPQGLGQKIDREKAGKDDYYSWSKTGDHPRGEAPRAAWFANHLLDVEFAKGDKPKRAKVKPGLTVEGEEVDVIAFDSHRDLPEDGLRVDVQEMQRKCLENPMEDILDSFGVEPKAAMMGQTQSQSGLEAFM